MRIMKPFYTIFISTTLFLLLTISCIEDRTLLTDRASTLDTLRSEWIKYYEAGQYDSVIVRTTPFLNVSIAERDTLSVIYSAIFIAQAHILMENTDSIPRYIKILQSYYIPEKVNDGTLLTLYHNILGINALKIDLDYSFALECFAKNLEIDKKQGDTANIIVSLANIASIYLMKDDISGMKYATEAYELSQTESVPDYLKCHSALVLSEMAYLNKEYDNSQKYLNQCLEIARNNDYLYHYSLIHLIQANLYTERGKYEQADAEYQLTKKYLSFSDPTTIVRFCLSYGIFCSSHNRYNEAIALMKDGIRISYKHRNPALREQLLRSLSEIYDLVGNPTEALAYYKKYVSYQDSVSAVERERKFGKLILELKNMEHSNEIHSKEIEVLKANRLLLTTIGILAIITTALIFSWLLYARQKKTYKALVTQHQNYIKRQDCEEAKKKMPNDDYRELFERIDKAMKQEHLYRLKDLTQEKLADILQTNRTYISKAINKYAGMSFVSYINMHRIGEATRMISQPDFDMPFKQLADMMGYNSVSVFTKAFQRETGLPPGVYHKEISRASAKEIPDLQDTK